METGRDEGKDKGLCFVRHPPCSLCGSFHPIVFQSLYQHPEEKCCHPKLKWSCTASACICLFFITRVPNWNMRCTLSPNGSVSKKPFVSCCRWKEVSTHTFVKLYRWWAFKHLPGLADRLHFLTPIQTSEWWMRGSLILALETRRFGLMHIPLRQWQLTECIHYVQVLSIMWSTTLSIKSLARLQIQCLTHVDSATESVYHTCKHTPTYTRTLHISCMVLAWYYIIIWNTAVCSHNAQGDMEAISAPLSYAVVSVRRLYRSLT